MIDDRTRTGRHRARSRALVLLLAVMSPALLPAPAAAQQPTAGTPTAGRALSLDDAIRLAARESEALQIARAGVSRANGQLRQARSQYLPQLNSSVTYARTLKSQFEALASGGGTDTSTSPKPQSLCTPPIPANATPAERAAALAQASTCPAAQGIDFSKVGFGARNQWAAGLSFSQNVFAGGRISGQNIAAAAGRRAAEVEVTAQRAQLALDVTQAYFDAVLADRLVTIADTTLAQTEELLRQTTVARRVGNQSEFELLRATVTRDNQRPVLIARRGDRDVAYFRLKQLLNLPLDEPIALTTPIDQPATITRVIAANAANVGNAAPGAAASVVDTLVPLPLPDTTTSDRAPVRESEESLRASEGQLRVARADRLPSLSLTSQYQRLFFPQTFFPTLNQFSENWTIGGALTFSLFNGGRVGGNIEAAQANLAEARARLQQSRELAALDTRVSLNQLQQAEASFSASRGTAQQAQRAYSIDQIRYREGISTQTDLTQSRLLLEQALANQAQSARDLAVARARIVLLRDLPLNTQALGGAASRAASQQQQPPQQQQQQQQPTQQQTPSTAASAPGVGQSGSFTQ
ncbi:MAG TPA: TolC family protein [Gemmatimonadaceae bacterium]|nr:TolC family protein [Gemmatimonadaceae bacterium]